MLVNITNDAWYGHSSAPVQSLAMAVLRAVENRRALVRSANTGISAFVDPLGRISGETAPLLFTAYSNQFWSTDLFQPMANVPMVIYQYAMSPYDSWNALAWAGALMVMLFVLVLSLIARAILLRNRMPNHD